MAQLLSWLQISVLVCRGDVYLAVDALLDAFDDLVDAHILLHRHAHAVVNARPVGVEQEILGVDRHDLDSDASFFHHTDGSLTGLARDRLRGRFEHLFGLHDDLADARAIDFSHQLNLIDSFSDLVLLKVFHQLGFEHLDIQRIAVNVFEIVFNVKKVALAEDGLHDLSVPRLHRLLGGWRHDSATLRLACLVLRGPFATEDALVFEVIVEEVRVPIVAPAVAVVGDKGC